MSNYAFRLAAVASVAAFLAACGGSGNEPTANIDEASGVEVSESISEETDTEDLPAAETMDVPTATVEQYASVIAELQPGLEEYIANVEQCSLGGWDEDSLLCPFTPLTLIAQASTLSVRFSDEAREDLRLDAPPAEIEGLVQRSRDASQAVVASAEIVSECDTYEECEAEWFDLQLQASNLQGVLDAWSPYL